VTLQVEVAFGTRRPWSPSARRLTDWARAAGGRAAGRAVLAISVVTPRESRVLNRAYRGKDRPTNVLSFPAGAAPRAARGVARPLGDLAICAAVVASEARRQRKTLEAHWAHMVVHGVLHLLGHDHVRRRDAERMERREVRLLARLGFADPYEVATDG
jgi:probable rRNA maturation factor